MSAKWQTPNNLLALLNADLRTESSFQAGIAPAQGRPWPTVLLIIRNNALSPFLQGFLWALLKDWMAVATVAMKVGGSSTGRGLRVWLREWLQAAPSLRPEASKRR